MLSRHTKSLLLLLIMLVSVAPVWAQDSSSQGSDVAPLPLSFKLNTDHLTHFAQTWNNCSGATISMGLSYFGFTSTHNSDQDLARKYLKPNWEDQNVSPWQLVDYVNNVAGPQYGVKTLVRRGGDLDLLKRLLVADFPVIIEKGYDEQELDWMGHYLLLIGYDDSQQIFYSYDSFLGSNGGDGRPEPYDFVSTFWRQFNDTFLVLYPPQREAEVQTILGELWDEEAGWQRAKERAQLEAAANPDDYWAWFNLGEAATGLGEYQVATIAYRQALNSGQMPWRTFWYMHGIFEAFYHTGEFKEVLRQAEILQNITPYIEEANYYRGLVYASQGRVEDAIFRFDRVLEFNPNFYPAADAKLALQNGTFEVVTQTD